MFSGIGGFELGIHRVFDSRLQGVSGTKDTEGQHQPDNQGSGRGLQQAVCIGYSEIDKYAIETYEHNFGKETKNFGNATTINTDTLPDFDLLVGGFPCQAFSIAGKRAGFDDTRGTLIFDVVRILRDKRPRHFVLENVKGLLSHEGGKTFSHILEILTDSGYDVSWSVHNSKNYGVPQNRERIYLIGNLRGERRPKVFPIRQDDRKPIGEGVELRREIQSNETRNDQADSNTDSQVLQDGENRPLHTGNNIQQIGNIHSYRDRPNPNTGRIYSTEGISPTLSTMQGGGLEPKIAIPVLTPERPEKRQNGRRFKENGDPSFTLTAQDKHGLFDGVKIRKLTPTECERLQGFPDNWTQGSDTQRYKQCGNAVSVPVVEHVISELMSCL